MTVRRVFVRRALAASATALALALGLAACSANAEDQGTAAATRDPQRSRSAPSATAPTQIATTTPAVDHAMPAPGPRTAGILAPADILVVSGATIAPETLARISALKGVTALSISLAQPVIENTALTVAAVDPGAYRNFTPPKFADFQDAWDRVAGGELALKRRLQDRLPTDADGYLRLGGASEAPLVHIGAYVDQQPLIDAVLNPTWVETLGMTRDNALLVRTGATAPAAVREQIEKLVGAGDSVTLVDKATRIGLDPGAVQVAVVTGTVADAVGVYRYTVLGGGRIKPDPAWVDAHISTRTVPILGSVTCNTLMFAQLGAALAEIEQRGLADKIHPGEYAGCYNARFIAGSTTLSNHAFGLALDINTPGNQRGTVGEIDAGVVEVFKRWGFGWGGDWRYTDPMHFEMARLVNPGASPSTSEAP